MNSTSETDQSSPPVVSKRRSRSQSTGVNKFANIKIHESIGKGGFGEVFKATLDQKKVAVKKCPRPRPRHPEDLDPKMEASIMKKLSVLSDHLIKFIGTYEEPQHFCIVMEYCRYGSLCDHIRQKGVFNPSTSRRVVVDIATVLDLIHKNGYLYRDLSPKNVLIYKYKDNIPYIKLIDFGLSKLQTDVKGTTCGTPGYAAVKYLKQSNWSSHMDYYSLGCVLLYMLTQKTFADQTRPGPSKQDILKHVSDVKAQEFIIYCTHKFASITGIADIHKHPFIIDEAIEHQSMNSKSRTDLPNSQNGGVLATLPNGGDIRNSREAMPERSSRSSGPRKNGTGTSAASTSTSRPPPELPPELTKRLEAPESLKQRSEAPPDSPKKKTFGPRQPRSASVSARGPVGPSHATSLPDRIPRNPSVLSLESRNVDQVIPWPYDIGVVLANRKVKNNGRVIFNAPKKLAFLEYAPNNQLNMVTYIYRAGKFNQTVKVFKPKAPIVDLNEFPEGVPEKLMFEYKRFDSLEELRTHERGLKMYNMILQAHRKLSEAIRFVLEYPFDNLSLQAKILYNGEVTVKFGKRLYTFRTKKDVDRNNGLTPDEKEQCHWILDGHFKVPPEPQPRLEYSPRRR